MIDARVFVSGVEYRDIKELNVTRSISDYNIISNFDASLDSPYGRHSSDFQIANDILIYGGEGPINGLTTQWRLNEGMGSKIYGELNPNIMSVMFNTANWSSGVTGSAVLFNGNSTYIDAGSIVPYISGLTQGTLSLWFNIGSQTTQSLFAMTQGNLTSNDYCILYAGSTTTDYANESLSFFIMSGASQYLSLFLRNGESFYMDNTWHHVAVVVDGTNNRMYIDGGSTAVTFGAGGATTNGMFTNVQGANTIRIGNRRFNSDNTLFTSGLMSDIRIYDRGLSQNEITTLYNSGSGTKDFRLFNGILENIEFNGEGLTQELELSGKDYTTRLIDLTVQPVVYSNIEVGSLIRNNLMNNVQDLTVNHVSGTSTTLSRIVYNHDRIYDAIQDLAKTVDYISYVDQYKDLHFEPRQSKDTNLNLGSQNVLNMKFATNREGMTNKIWVYGDRYLTANPIQTFSVGSPNVGGNLGSVFTLTNKPFNTNVSILGSVQLGGVFNNLSTSTSGVSYFINFEDKQLIFPSGTTFGYYLPPSGGSIIVNYNRQVPIAKYGEEPSSVILFGPKEEVIIDKGIKDPKIAEDIVRQRVNDANPFSKIETNINGWYEFNPGHTVTITQPNLNINQSGVSILAVNYKFNPETVNRNNVINLSLSKKLLDLTDTIKEMNQRLTSLEATDTQVTDVLTRMVFDSDSVQPVGSRWILQDRTLGSSFILGKGYHGVTGATFGGILGSIIASGINFLGDSRGGLTILASGGNDYSVTGSYNAGGGLGGGTRTIFG